ncbi:MAG TPA: three component ABC system middle component [Ktedonobacterales bacterium]
MRMLSLWDQLAQVEPVEMTRLLNPAYCAMLLARCAVSYQNTSANVARRGLPYALVYLCLPLTLHAGTRTSINRHNSEYGLHRYVREHPEALFHLPERVDGLRSATTDGMLFGTAYNVLAFDTQSASFTGTRSIVSRLTAANLDQDAAVAVRAADRLGAWFGNLTTTEVFLFLGLRP